MLYMLALVHFGIMRLMVLLHMQLRCCPWCILYLLQHLALLSLDCVFVALTLLLFMIIICVDVHMHGPDALLRRTATWLSAAVVALSRCSC